MLQLGCRFIDAGTGEVIVCLQSLQTKQKIGLINFDVLEKLWRLEGLIPATEK